MRHIGGLGAVQDLGFMSSFGGTDTVSISSKDNTAVINCRYVRVLSFKSNVEVRTAKPLRLCSRVLGFTVWV